MKYGLSEAQLVQIIDFLAKYPEVERAILFGSRAIDTFKAASDVDIAIDGVHVTHALAARIKLDFEEDTYLPYFFDIIAYPLISEPALTKHIDHKGVVLYQRQNDAQPVGAQFIAPEASPEHGQKGEVSGWSSVIIGEHVDLVSGYAFKSSNFMTNKSEGSLPVVKIKNVANGDVNLRDVVYHSYNPSLEKFLLSKGDVLIAMTGNHPQARTQVVGDISKYKIEEKSLLNQRVGKLISKNETNLDFIYYLFKSEETRFYLANQSSGSANQANISKNDILNLILDIPTPTEQKAIAAVLSSLDDKIDLLHRQNQTLEAMAQTLFRQWFVEEAREGWEVKKLGELTKIGIGRTPPRKESQWFSTSTDDVKWISIKDMGNDGVFIFKTSECLTNQAVVKFNVPIIPKDTVVLSFKMTVGRVAITTENMLSNEAIAHFKLDEASSISKEYLYLYLKDYQYETLGSTSSIVTAINSAMIKDMEVLQPDSETMREFTQAVQSKFEKISTNQQQIQTLNQLRDTLLPKLMSGEVRVSFDQQIEEASCQ
jgi:type I restriction enzyme S subunit